MNLDDEELSKLIRQHATRHSAPDALRAGVRTQIALLQAGRSAPSMPGASPRRGWFELRWRTASVSFALGLAGAWVVLPTLQRLDPNEPVDAVLVADHVQALKAGSLTQVESTDRHTIKPWFQGKLDYAPPVFDLAAGGFPATGGRVEHLRGEAIATLVYAHNRHVIDVFVWPSALVQAPVRSLRRGFNVLNWADGSMQYWAVSDLDRVEMERFGQLWLEQAAKQ